MTELTFSGGLSLESDAYVISAMVNKINIDWASRNSLFKSSRDQSVYMYVPCLSNICYLVCGFEKSAHHTHTHSLFLCFSLHTHTHTHHVQTPLQGFVGQCISSSVQIKEREARLRGKHSVPLDRIIYNVELFSYMVLKNVHAFHI